MKTFTASAADKTAPDADAGSEHAEDATRFPVEVPLEGDELDLSAPDGIDLATLPQTGRALVEYSMDCKADGSACRLILGKICLPAGDGEGYSESDEEEATDGAPDADAATETTEPPANPDRPDGVAAMLEKAMSGKKGRPTP